MTDPYELLQEVRDVTLFDVGGRDHPQLINLRDRVDACLASRPLLAWVPHGSGFRALGRDGTLYEVLNVAPKWKATQEYLWSGPVLVAGALRHPTAEAARAACADHERSRVSD